jgi:hypothetical protein
MISKLTQSLAATQILMVSNRAKYMPHLVMDGNFKLENLQMRRPQDDVRLRDGGGYMAQSEPYATHLRITPVTKTVRIIHLGKYHGC